MTPAHATGILDAAAAGAAKGSPYLQPRPNFGPRQEIKTYYARAYFTEKQPVYLVYGTATPGGDEPLIAVLDSEGKAANLESRITRDTLGSEVRWEEHHVAGPLDGDTAIAIVMHNPSPLGTGNPVASSVHSDVAAATDEAARQRRDGFDVEVLELRLGWELPDWPPPERVTPHR